MDQVLETNSILLLLLQHVDAPTDVKFYQNVFWLKVNEINTVIVQGACHVFILFDFESILSDHRIKSRISLVITLLPLHKAKA